MEIKKMETTYLSKTKMFEVVIDDKRIAKVSKWWKEDTMFDEYECDYEIINAEDLKLTDDENDELADIILEVK